MYVGADTTGPDSLVSDPLLTAVANITIKTTLNSMSGVLTGSNRRIRDAEGIGSFSPLRTAQPQSSADL